MDSAQAALLLIVGLPLGAGVLLAVISRLTQRRRTCPNCGQPKITVTKATLNRQTGQWRYVNSPGQFFLSGIVLILTLVLGFFVARQISPEFAVLYSLPASIAGLIFLAGVLVAGLQLLPSRNQAQAIDYKCEACSYGWAEHPPIAPVPPQTQTDLWERPAPWMTFLQRFVARLNRQPTAAPLPWQTADGAPGYRANAIRYLLLAALVIGLVALMTSSPQPDESHRHHEEAGGFSYVPPPDWQLEDYSGSRYQVAFGTATHGFAPFIFVTEDRFEGSLNSYLEAVVYTLREDAPDLRLTRRDDFQTLSGEWGIRLSADGTYKEEKLHHTFYLFDGGAKILIVRCTRPADVQEEVDTLCDDSMRTFRFESR
jgi:hypothetical protein